MFFVILESDFLGISEWSEELERLNTTGGILEMFFCKKLGVKDAAIFILHYIYIYIYILWLETLFYQPWILLYSNLWLEDWRFRVFEGVTFFRFCWVGSFRRCYNSFHSLVVTQFSCFILRLWNIPHPWHEIFRSERDAHQFFSCCIVAFVCFWIQSHQYDSHIFMSCLDAGLYNCIPQNLISQVTTWSMWGTFITEWIFHVNVYVVRPELLFV